MRPLHIGLLVVGAGLAGGLAVRMTQPPTIPLAAVTAPAVPPVAPPVSAAAPNVPLQAPAAIAAKPVKPSPIPKPALPVVADAPAPVYAEAPKPPTRPAKPVLMAKTSAQKAAPTQWSPTPYQTPDHSPQAQPSPEAAPVISAQSPAPRHVTLQTGMTVVVRLQESLSSDRANPGDTFEATLAEPLVVDDLVIAERGARATGRVVDAQRGARLWSPSALELALISVFTSDGQRVGLPTDPWVKQADRADDPLGAIFLRPKAARVLLAAIIRFRLSSRVTVTEQIAAR